MRTLAAVCVHDRLPFLAQWLHAWHYMCPRPCALLVVNPYDGGPHPGVADLVERIKIRDVSLVNRPNQGWDIAAFRSVVMQDAVPSDVLCWFTDDCLPMRRDVFAHFTDPFEDPSVGLVAFAYEPASPTNSHPHARTVAFAVRTRLARTFRFPSRLDTYREPDRSTCFEFEHGPDNMYLQVRAAGYKALATTGAPMSEPGYSHWAGQGADGVMVDAGHAGLPVTAEAWARMEHEFSHTAEAA